jgi:hypothetical protein
LKIATTATASTGNEPSQRAPAPPGQPKWWQQAVIYQIALMSFQDTNMRGDEGLISRLRK